MELFLNDKLGKISVEVSKPITATSNLVLAHGAGAGMNHTFMANLSELLTKQNIRVIRFNFPYMEQGKKAPGSQKTNILCWQLVLEHMTEKYNDAPIFISGKSYGGRMASHLLAEEDAMGTMGIIYFGFPLHAPGRDSKDRAAHLSQIDVPQLFLQGEKDKLANIDLIKEVTDSLTNTELQVFEHADHSFHVPKKSGKSDEEVLQLLSTKASEWIKEQL